MVKLWPATYVRLPEICQPQAIITILGELIWRIPYRVKNVLNHPMMYIYQNFLEATYVFFKFVDAYLNVSCIRCRDTTNSRSICGH